MPGVQNSNERALSAHAYGVQADKAAQQALFQAKDWAKAECSGLSPEYLERRGQADKAAAAARQAAFKADNAACVPRNAAAKLAREQPGNTAGLQAARQQVAAAEAEADRLQQLADEAERTAADIVREGRAATAAQQQAATELSSAAQGRQGMRHFQQFLLETLLQGPPGGSGQQ